MPVTMPNPLIPLSAKQGKPVSAFFDAKEQASRTAAFDAQTEAQTEQTNKAVLEAKRLAEFESIVRGVNEASPLLDKVVNATEGREFTSSVLELADTLRRRAFNIESTNPGGAQDTLSALQQLEAGDFEGMQKDFTRVKEMNEFRQKAEFAGSSFLRQTPAAILDRADLIGDFSDEDQVMARRVEAGLLARAGTTSSRERIATDPDLTEDVAESEATIIQRKKFAEKTAMSRANFIDKAFDRIQGIATNIRNLDRAIVELENGASTGAIEERFPSFREATVKLNQIQSELALDVVGAVTFGALSKGELDLAKDVALPTGLQPEPLRLYLISKKTAQEKLLNYFSEQIDFLDQGGTVAGFLRSMKRKQDRLDAQADSTETLDDGTTVTFQ